MSALVLLVDDSASVRHQLRAVLQRSGEFERFLEATDGLEAFKLMSEHQPDVVVCDLVMPRFDGLKFLALRSTRTELKHIPVIMLTASDGTDTKVEVFERGAADYVTKPFNEKELLARVRVHYRVKVLQDQLRRANENLASLAVTDGLTGLFNRREFDRLLIAEVRRTLRYKSPLSLLMIDIDHFKQVNDTYGHPMGDEVLRQVSRIVTERIRATDYACRYGGEEIAVLLPQSDSEGAAALAGRLRAEIDETSFTLHDVTVRRTASFGVATFEAAEHAIGPEELVRRADEALYAAKHGGRNRFIVWRAG